MKRICYLALGHICVILGIIGAFLPGLPTVVFLIIAAWAYGKSSERFQRLILEHPKYGPLVKNWQDYGVIPLRAKILAGVMMLISAGFCFFKAHHWLWPTILASFMTLIYAFILSRPSRAADITSSA